MNDPQFAPRASAALKWLDTLNATVHEIDDAGIIVESRGVLVSLRTATYTGPALRQIRAMYRKLQAPAVRLGSLAVYRFDKIDLRSFADDEVRSGLRALAKDSEGLFHANAVVIDSPGIISAAIRSAGSGIMLAARPKTPPRFFDRASLAVDWLMPQLPSEKDPAAVAHFERVLRAMDEAVVERRSH